jgi:hypothetical protein
MRVPDMFTQQMTASERAGGQLTCFSCSCSACWRFRSSSSCCWRCAQDHEVSAAYDQDRTATVAGHCDRPEGRRATSLRCEVGDRVREGGIARGKRVRSHINAPYQLLLTTLGFLALLLILELALRTRGQRSPRDRTR